MKIKYVLVCLLILISCGCKKEDIEPNDNIDVSVQRRETLKKQAKIIFDEPSTDEDSLYISYLYSFINNLSNQEIFSTCNQETTRIQYTHNDIINDQYKIITDCDNVITSYYYNSLDDEEPIYVDVK